MQSRDGYLWIATDNMLARFDGVRFSGITRLAAHAIEVDRAGALWSVDMHSVVARHGASPLRLTIPDDGEPAYTRTPVLAAGEGGRMFVQADRGSPLYVVEGGALRPYTLPGGEPVVGAVDVVDEAGRTWVARPSSIVEVADGAARGVERGPCVGAPIRRFHRAPSGRLWLALEDGTVCSPAHGDAPPVRIDHAGGLRGGAPLALREDRSGTLWIGTRTGLFRYDGALHAVPLRLTAARVASLFEDRDGTLWVGLLTGVVSLRRSPVTMADPPDGSWRAAVRTLTADGAEVFAGGQRGEIVRLGPGGVVTLRAGSDALQPVSALVPRGERGLLVGDLASLHWLGGPHDGASVLPAGVGVRAAVGDTAAGAWVVTSAGLYRVDGPSAEHVELGIPDAEHNLRAVTLGADGALWLSVVAAGSSYLLHGRPGQLDRVTAPPELTGYRLAPLRFDRRGVLWMGTNGAGVARFEGGRFGVVDRRRGLFDDDVWEAVDDDAGRLWMTSDRGLWWASITELDEAARGARDLVVSRSYGPTDGLRTAEFNGGTSAGVVRSADGRIWAASMDGVAVVDPTRIDRLGRSAPLPAAVVEALTVDGAPRAGPGDDGVIDVPPGGRHFAIEYTAPTSVDATRLRFRYRLDGFDPGWVDADARRVAYYTGLEPGAYTFRVVATAGTGTDGGAEARVAFRVRPFAWQTRWFRVLVGFAFAGLLLGAYRLRVARLRARQRELEATVAERTRELAAEKARSERLLRDMLPDPIADRLLAGATNIADEHACVTALFADLVGFTELASRTSPEALVALLNDVFSRFDALASGLGVEKIKTIGDAYFAAAGCPAPSSDHAHKLAELALGMLDAIDALNVERGTSLALRVGLHSGPVVAGVIGTTRFTYDLWGDTVNTAARMESHGAPGRVHLSRATAELLAGAFRIVPRGEIRVKGKGVMGTSWLLRAGQEEADVTAPPPSLA